MVVKPVLTILSLPFIIVTMGIFVLIINAAMVALTIWLLPDVTMGFWQAVLSAIVISIINFLVNLLVPAYNKR
jgi:putative membrane protein